MSWPEAQYAADTAIKGTVDEMKVIFPNLILNSLASRLVCRSSASADVGKTVTVTDGVTTFSKTFDSKLAVTFDLPGKARYTVTVKKGTTVEFTQNVDIGIGEYLDIEVGLIKTTWKGLKAIVNNHMESSMCKVGDEIVETLTTGEKVYFRIAAINHDAAHQLIFESHYCLEQTRQMNLTNTNAGSWGSTELRKWLNSTFLSQLSPDLQAVISERTAKYSAGSQSSNLVTVTDKIWLPREWEIFGATSYAAGTEHTQGGAQQFPIYATAANRAKTLGKVGGLTHWWEASPGVSITTSFCFVNAGGTPGSDSASGTFGVTPCFQIVSP